MKPELEALLKAYDAFRQAPEGSEASRLYANYKELLEETARTSRVSKETLENAVRQVHPRWVRANLPPGFPRKLGLE